MMNWLQELKAINQDHIVDAYNKANPEQQKNLQQQVKKLNAVYPGGLKQYHETAVKLLKQSANNINPFDDYKVGIPNGVNMDFHNQEMVEKYETLGMKEFQHTAFVLVAGGLGERLGYPGIKIGIPMELLTNKTFLSYYVDYILAYQQKYCPKGVIIPFVIMTSDDTYSQTVDLLAKNKDFGMEKGQITIVKQEKIPAMTDNDARFALSKDKLEIQTKPHGHGDIHTLLYQHKLVEDWHKRGIKWILVFQDTNPLCFRSFAALLGITQEKDFDFNSIGVPRKPGDAVGAITSLVHKETGKSLTINVEYNMLEAMFKESGGEKVEENGNSVFPGNSNCFVIKVSQYHETLKKTGGVITEFINPKYADATKTTFKSYARLQCMMQDYPKLLDNCDKVGFTNIEKGFSFTAAKNDPVSAAAKFKSGLAPESAGSCESDVNHFNRVMLRLSGAQIEESDPVEFGEVKLSLYPMVSLSPFFATCLTEMRSKVKKLKITAKSSLTISADCVLQDVEIDGHQEISKGGNISLKCDNRKYKELTATEGNQEPYLLIRKFKLIN